MVTNQFQRLPENSHSKNKCEEDSTSLLQLEHIEGKEQPLEMRLSSVGTLLCINLQQKKDLEGGMSKHHTVFLAQ